MSVSAKEIGGQGRISVLVVDQASRQPLPDQQSSVSGERDVVLGPNGSVENAIKWDWGVPASGPARKLPPRLAFLITVQLTDTIGKRVVATVRAFPGWLALSGFAHVERPPAAAARQRLQDNQMERTWRDQPQSRQTT